MHMIASRSQRLSLSTLPADNALAGGNACMCMLACMENLTPRDTF